MSNHAPQEDIRIIGVTSKDIADAVAFGGREGHIVPKQPLGDSGPIVAFATTGGRVLIPFRYPSEYGSSGLNCDVWPVQFDDGSMSVLVDGDGAADPELFQTLLEDEDYLKSLAVGARDYELPSGWQGLVVRGAQYGTLDNRIAFPAYEAVSDWTRGGRFSRRLYDITDDPPTLGNNATFCTFMRVTEPLGTPCSGPRDTGIAMVMGPGATGQGGFGLLAWPKVGGGSRRTAPPGQLVPAPVGYYATLDYQSGGPITRLFEATKWKLGGAADLRSAGITTNAIFAYNGGDPIKEGQITFDAANYKESLNGGVFRQTYLRWRADKMTAHPCGPKNGAWDFQTPVPNWEYVPDPIEVDPSTHFVHYYFEGQVNAQSFITRDPNPNGDPGNPIIIDATERVGGDLPQFGQAGGGGAGTGGGSSLGAGNVRPTNQGNQPTQFNAALGLGTGFDWEEPKRQGDGKPPADNPFERGGREYPPEADLDGDGRISANEAAKQRRAERKAAEEADQKAKEEAERRAENEKVLKEIREREAKRLEEKKKEERRAEIKAKRAAERAAREARLKRLKDDLDKGRISKREYDYLRRKILEERVRQSQRARENGYIAVDSYNKAVSGQSVGTRGMPEVTIDRAQQITAESPLVGDIVSMGQRVADYGQADLYRTGERDGQGYVTEQAISAGGYVGIKSPVWQDLTRATPEGLPTIGIVVDDLVQGTITPKADGVQDGWDRHVNDSGDLAVDPYTDAIISDEKQIKIDGVRQPRDYAGVITLAEVQAFGATTEGEVDISGRIPGATSLAQVWVGANTAAGGVTALDVTAGTNNSADNVLSTPVDATDGSLANRQGNAEKHYLVDETDVGGLRIKLATTGGNLADVTGLGDGIAYRVRYAAEPAPPTIAATASLTLFSAPQSGAASASQSYTLKAGNLKSAVVVSAPNAFQLSTDDTNWLSELTLLPDVGKSSFERTIYVRLNSATSHSAGWQFSGNIEHTATDATQVDVAVSGSDVFLHPDIEAANLQADISAGAIDEWIDNIGNYGPLEQATVPLQPTKSGNVVQFNGSQYLNIPQDLADAMEVDNPGILMVTTYASGIQYYISFRGSSELMGFYRDGGGNLRGIDTRDGNTRTGFVADSAGTVCRAAIGKRNAQGIVSRDTTTGNIVTQIDVVAGPFNGGTSGTNRSVVGGTVGVSFLLGLVGDVQTILYFSDDFSSDLADIIAALEAGGNA